MKKKNHTLRTTFGLQMSSSICADRSVTLWVLMEHIRHFAELLHSAAVPVISLDNPNPLQTEPNDSQLLTSEAWFIRSSVSVRLPPSVEPTIGRTVPPGIPFNRVKRVLFGRSWELGGEPVRLSLPADGPAGNQGNSPAASTNTSLLGRHMLLSECRAHWRRTETGIRVWHAGVALEGSSWRGHRRQVVIPELGRSSGKEMNGHSSILFVEVSTDFWEGPKSRSHGL